VLIQCLGGLVCHLVLKRTQVWRTYR
jgi:hypothetical protein